MALYSFCVKKIGTTEYAIGHTKHELAFLDYLAMQFNSKEELLKFIGAPLDKYDDIAIVYQNNGEKKVLPLYFDAPELENVCKSMINFNSLEECDSIYLMLAYGYTYGGLISIDKSISTENKDFDKIAEKILTDSRVKIAYKAGLANEKVLQLWDEGYDNAVKRELAKSYINFRKAYMSLRDNDYILGKENPKEVPSYTLKELIKRHTEAINKTKEICNVYNALKDLKLTSYEENLVVRILRDDENAYEELMASSTDRLEYLKPLLDYLAEKRGKAKKIGTID